jgi:carboxyl-terminal processing protease
MKKKTLIFAVTFLGVGFLAFRPVDRLFEIQKNLDIFATAFREVNQLYVDEVNPNTLMKTGIDAMLNSLDPYTNYIPEDEIEDYRTMTTGQYGGIGANVVTRDGRSVVNMPFEGFAAEKAGIKIGDEILKINGVTLKGKNTNDVHKLLKGQAGTKITLEIIPVGQTTPKEVSFNRENIKIDNVRYYNMVAPEIGYLSLTDFTRGASKEVKNAIEKLKGQGAKKIILDVRGNPGGLLDEAVDICNLFINRDLEVVSTKGKVTSWNKTYKSLNSAYDLDIPLVVMTNGRSASASEIVAGVMQDYDRGVLIGQKSFGKGLVQSTKPLSYNSQIKITTAKYYTPSGRCIQALDYSKRKQDGSVEKFADSLKRAFKTKNGRVVFDGAGIDPDMAIPAKKTPAILRALRDKHLIFDYATTYTSKLTKLPSPREFRLSDAEYQDFIKWVKTKGYDYTTTSEKMLKELDEKSKDEKANVDSQIKALQAKFQQNKETDLLTFKEEIRAALENDIVARFYFEKGQTEAQFNYDDDLKMAISILKDANRYQELLKKK